MKYYTVIYEQAPDGWSAYVPDLPGCVAAASSREEVEELMREAIAFHIEGMRAHGEPIPEPTAYSGKVAVTA